MADGLRFDAAVHAYYLGEERLPSVTQVLADTGLARYGGPPGEAGWQRGTAVHEACRLLDLGKLDRASLDDRLTGYVQGWEAFKEAVPGIKFEAVEEPVHDKVYRFAGTPDRVGLAKCRDGRYRPIVLDIKTGGPSPWHALQTAGYTIALGFYGVARRGAVYLDGKGRFRYVEHESATDADVFLAALAVHRWRKSVGAKEAT